MSRLALYIPTGSFGEVRNPFGKDRANLGLFRALARHGGFEELGILSHGAADPEAARRALFGADASQTRLWTQSALRTSAAARAGAVLRGTPDLADLAWMRSRMGDDAFSLLGLIHTLAPPAIRERIAQSVVAPLQPWDALICTSPAVRDATRELLGSWGEYLAQRFGGRAPAPPRLPLIPLGVEVEAIAAQADRPDARDRVRDRLGLGPDAVLVLWLGRLSWFEKAFPQPMFRAVAEAARLTGTSLHFAMAGWFPNGDADRRLYEEAARAYAPDVPVHLLDGNDGALVGELWAGCDIFLSLVDNIQETFGITPVEAMSAGKPVVASDWDGYRYTIRDGTDGMLIPTLGGPAGAGALMSARHVLGLDSYQSYVGAVAQFTAVDVGRAAAALATLVHDPELRRRMGAAGRANARRRFDWPVVAREIRGLVDALAAERIAVARSGRGNPSRAPNPAKGDPFTDFAAFATAVLAPATMLALRPGTSIEAARAELARAQTVRLDAVARVWRADAEDCASILNRLAEAGPLPLGEITAAFPPHRREPVALAVAWMCKLGMLGWDP